DCLRKPTAVVCPSRSAWPCGSSTHIDPINLPVPCDQISRRIGHDVQIICLVVVPHYYRILHLEPVYERFHFGGRSRSERYAHYFDSLSGELPLQLVKFRDF